MSTPPAISDMRPGCYDVDERVRDMSAGGQLAGLNFPNWTGFSGQVLNEGPDRDLNEIMIKAYNDWHIDEWCAAHPERFIPCGILPLFDVEKAAQEVRRLAAQGVPCRDLLREPGGLAHAVDPLGPLGPALRRVLRRGDDPVPARWFVVQGRVDDPRCPTLGPHEPVVDRLRSTPSAT